MDKRASYDFALMALDQKFDLPVGWEIYQWEVMNFETSAEYIAYSGAVVTKTFTKGPRKGRKNWAKENRSHDMTIPLTRGEIRGFIDRWSRETGICSNCHGSGTEVYGWSSTGGEMLRHCKACDGTGKHSEATA